MEITARKVQAQDCLYLKGIHKTVADAISWLEYDPSVNQTAESNFMTKVKSSKCSQRQNWIAVSKHWCNLEIDTNKHEDLNLVFANHGEEDEIYPFTTQTTCAAWILQMQTNTGTVETRDTAHIVHPGG
jgi:hypothetical protein